MAQRLQQGGDNEDRWHETDDGHENDDGDGVTMSLLASGISAAAALELHVKKTVTIAAPADKVWEASKNFNGLNTWHPALASDELQSGTNNTVGAIRCSRSRAAGTIKEKLLQFDEKGHRYRYAILESVLPVSHYSGPLSWSRHWGQTRRWSRGLPSFKRKNLSDTPPDNRTTRPPPIRSRACSKRAWIISRRSLKRSNRQRRARRPIFRARDR